MDYANEGNLRKCLPKFVKFNWYTKLNLLNDIITDLGKRHDSKHNYGCLHDGNIVTKRVKNNYNGLFLFQSFISNSKKNDRVLPFIAPEILRGGPSTLASDIYSFSIVMWELTSGKPPFNDREHDLQLSLSICDGERPEIIENIPQCYVDLMNACWDSDPSERPTAAEVFTIIQNWIYYILKYYKADNPLDIKHDIDSKLIKENIEDIIEEIDDFQLRNDTIEFWKVDKALAQQEAADTENSKPNGKSSPHPYDITEK